jgi:hypothetical protein
MTEVLKGYKVVRMEELSEGVLDIMEVLEVRNYNEAVNEFYTKIEGVVFKELCEVWENMTTKELRYNTIIERKIS